jgi:rhodanese-related sulfurtransferase
MAKTFMGMAAEAQASVPGVSPREARRRMQEGPKTIVVDVRDAEEVRATGMIPGAINVSAGSLLYKADQEVPEAWREPRLQDRSVAVITHCALGPLGAISAKTLKDMGFVNVSYLEGGIEGWKKAGLPTEPVRTKP